MDHFQLKIQKKHVFDNYNFELKDLKLQQYDNYKAVIGKIQISDLSTNKKRTLNPEIRIYDNPQTLTYEASIKTAPGSDHYLTMSNISRSDLYNI